VTAEAFPRTGVAASSRWWAVLTLVLVAGYLWIGLLSPLAPIRWSTLTGAALVLGALACATRSRRVALTALVAGAAFPAITIWSSVVVPVTGLLILLCGIPAIRSATVPSRKPGLR
jgi:hypothetical protein